MILALIFSLVFCSFFVQEKMPGSVSMAHVLTKRDSLLLLMKASKIKDNLNFQVILLFGSIEGRQFVPFIGSLEITTEVCR